MPVAQPGEELVSVRASALSQFTKSRASGAHYSASGALPAVAGSDGVGLTQDGRRVYFILPEAPFGAMAEFTRVSAKRCIELPEGLDDITVAAIANPGMSAWAALVNRAQIKPGDTVLVNGATGTAGRLAVQLARHLGAAKVIATGRDSAALETIEALGADVVIPFDLADAHPQGARDFEALLEDQFGKGIDVVVDYLWGRSAEIIIAAIARAVEDATPVRFVHVGAMSGSEIVLPGAALRSSAIMLMGSGIKSVPLADLLAAIGHVFDAVGPAKLQIATRPVPLSAVEETWDADSGKSRAVFTVE
ncbi:MAG TPA: zinc-binding alcohol dehydrogenase family protein [Rhodanobacter sp.]